MAIKKFGLNRNINFTGNIELEDGAFDVSGVGKIRFSIENADASNEIEIFVRIYNESDWDSLGTITGNDSLVVNADTYDELKVEVNTLDALSSNGFKILASGYELIGGAGGSSVELVDGVPSGSGTEGDVTIDTTTDTIYYWKDSVGWTAGAAASPSITSTYVGFGSVGNLLTGSSDFTFSDSTDTLSVSNLDINSVDLSGQVVDGIITDLAFSASAKLATSLAIKTYVDSQIQSKDAANEISYDNSTSSLVATDIQAAVDEVEGRVDTLESVDYVNQFNSRTGNVVPAASDYDADQIDYDNTASGLTATNTQDAVDEIEGRLDTAESGISTNQSNISDHISDTIDAHDASAISNSSSGNLSATDVQSALDELQGDIDSLNSVNYVNSFNSRTGAVVPAASDYDADQVDYDNTSTGLTATDTQAAIDEVEGRVDTAEGNITTNTNSLSTHLANDALSKHDADQIDLETVGTNYVGTNVEDVIVDLDETIGSLPTPSNYTPTDDSIIADHFSAIDIELGTISSNSSFSDDQFRIQDNVDATKEIAFEASTITTGTARTITMPDADVDLSDIATNNAKVSADGSVTSHSDVTDAGSGAIITSTERTKLSGIEELADVTDATNVAAAGATMDADTSLAGNSYFLDEDTMSSNSDTKVASQQSIKTYVDNRVSNAVHYRGGYDAATDSPSLDSAPNTDIAVGDLYTVTVAGTFYTVDVEVGDVLIAEAVDASTEAEWTIVNKNLDAASIKSSYESNSDTNAFTDSEKTLLSNQSGTNTGDQDLSPYDTHIADDSLLKHDADQIDYERADVDRKNIQDDATSGTVEAAISDLDDAIGELNATPANYTPTDASIVADHLEAIDTQLQAAGGTDFSDSDFRVSDNTDSSKKIALEASSITTSTTRTITMPDTDVDLGDIATKQDDVITAEGDLVIGNVSNEESRLAIGANGQVLQSDGTTASWQTLSTTDELIKISSNDTTEKYLEDAITTPASEGLSVSTLNDGGDEDLQIALDLGSVSAKATPVTADKVIITDSADSGKAKQIDLEDITAFIDHDQTINFVVNEHIDHSSVNINTQADSGLSGGGDITASRTLVVDINGTTEETSNDNADTILVYDDSATALRKMSRSNFLSGLASGNNSDISQTSFTGAESAVGADVTGLMFANATVRSFTAEVSVEIDATTDVFEHFTIKGVQLGSSWEISTTSVGEDTNILFDINNSGQVIYNSGTYAGFSSLTMKFRAETIEK